jgi:WbqC-like protein family
LTEVKRVAIVQSNYIPWKGYFDLINMVDEFILYDDRQFTRRDWRNRNRVKTPQGTIWLTVPVRVKGKYHQRIDETLVDGDEWRDRHWQTLSHSYGSAPAFAEYAGRFRSLYVDAREQRLSLINRALIECVMSVLGIETTLRWSTDYDVTGDRTERLVALCRAAAATTYLSGPAARAYLDESQFATHGIAVEWMDYEGYPEYRQLYPPFEHGVSVLDLIFNLGVEAPTYMKSFA